MTSALDTARQQLAPTGVLKAALNLSNSLLNRGRDASGQWLGVAPDLARAIAQALDVAVDFVPYATPSQVASAVDAGQWTIALIAADPARSGAIVFTAPYSQIEAAYMVPPGSAIARIDEVDVPGRRIAAYKGSAYGLWLERHLRHATLVDGQTFEDAYQRFRAGDAEVLASLATKLLDDQAKWPGARILDGLFMTVQQAVGCSAQHVQAADFLRSFIDDANRSGLIARLIERNGAVGLRAAVPEPTSGQG